MKWLLGAAALTLGTCADQEMGLPECDPVADGSPAAEVAATREAFNRAIARRDADAIAQFLDEDAVLITGSGSERVIGAEAQLALWREDAEEGADAVLYERNPVCIRASAMLPIVHETGAWRGVRGEEDFVAGTYSAKWRKDDSRWKLEAEIFSSEGCGGNLCP